MEIDFEKGQLGLESNERIRTFLRDTSLKNPLDSVIAELKLKRNPDYKKQLASVYLQKGDLQHAQDYLDSAMADEPANTDMYDIGLEAISCRANPQGYITALKANATLKNKLLTMAGNPLSAGYGQARAWLSQAFGMKFNEHWVWPAPNGNRSVSTPDTDADFVLFPNPAGNSINIAYPVADDESASASFTDVSGRIIRSITLKPGADMHSVETDAFNNGLYFVSLRKGQALIAVKKIVIMK